jgi:hypothetical protein
LVLFVSHGNRYRLMKYREPRCLPQ